MPLHSGQVEYLRETAKRKTRINVLVPANRWGKAQSLESPVLTPTGWVKMGDITPDMEVIGGDGLPTVVTDVFPQGEQPMYQLVFDDGSSTEAAANHLWKIQTGVARFKVKSEKYHQWTTLTTKEILDKWGAKPTKHTAVAIPMVEPVNFTAQPVTVDPYMLGLLLGDGGLTAKSAILTTADAETEAYIRKNYDVTSRGKYGFCIKGMYKELRGLGLMGLGSVDKFVPQNYLYNTVEVRTEVLRGLMDTDGSINTKNKKIEFNNCSKQLADNVKFLVQSLGGKVRMTSRLPYYKKDGVKIMGKLSYRLSIDIRTCPFNLSRKRSIWEQKAHFYKPHRLLRTIEYLGEKEAQCIRVASKEHTYVTDDFIVTHNSSLIACLQIWYHFYKFGIPPGNRESWIKAEYRTANIAPHSAQTEAVFKAINQILTSTYAIKTPDGRLVTNQCQIEWFYLKNKTLNTPPYRQSFLYNSYIEHRSLGADQGDALQGKPYGLITYDEGGRSLHLKDEVMGNIMPRLGDWMGPFHLLSTPDQNSPSILYHYDLYTNGKNGLKNTYTQEGSLKENLLFGQEQIDEQYALYSDDPMGPQVLEGKFMFGGDNLFPVSDILEAQIEDLNDGKRAEEGHNYVIGTDTAMASDEMVHSVLDITNLKVSRETTGLTISGTVELVKQTACKGNSKSPQRHINDFCDLFDAYSVDGKRPAHLLETWNGESARFYQDLPLYIQAATKCYGSWQPEKPRTDNKNPIKEKNKSIKKADILISLQKLLAVKALKIFKNDPNRHSEGADLSQQMSIYKEDDKNIPTDRALSLSLACWIAIEQAQKQQVVVWSDW